MKIRKLILLSFWCFFFPNLFAQENFVQFSINRFNKWTFIDFEYIRMTKSNFEITLGSGVNINPILFDQSKLFIPSHPYPKKVYQLFNLNYGIKKNFKFKIKDVFPYIVYQQHLYVTPFKMTELYEVDSIYFRKDIITEKYFIFNQFIGLGLEMKISSNTYFNVQSGLTHYKFGKQGSFYTLGYQLGLKIALKSKPVEYYVD